MTKDWYEHSHELEPDMVFTSCWGFVKLDRRVPGDGTRWYAATWSGSQWAYEDFTVEPGDLKAWVDKPKDMCYNTL